MTRRGTEKRQRTCVVQARCLEPQAEAIRVKAERAGMSVSALILKAVLDAPAARAIRKPSIDHQLAARVLAQLGKIGSNVNQLAHYAHLGRFQSNSIEVALRDLSELRLACLQALGQEPDRATGEEA